MMFNENEQEKITNEFLKVIDINDNKKLVKDNVEIVVDVNLI